MAQTITRNLSPAERFALQTGDPESATGCVLWRGSLTRGGYGQFSVDGRAVLVHRFAWEQVHGAIPPGLQIDHVCEVRACVNPEHLEPVTPSENTRRGWARLSPERRARRIAATTARASAAAADHGAGRPTV